MLTDLISAVAVTPLTASADLPREEVAWIIARTFIRGVLDDRPLPESAGATAELASEPVNGKELV